MQPEVISVSLLKNTRWVANNVCVEKIVSSPCAAATALTFEICCGDFIYLRVFFLQRASLAIRLPRLIRLIALVIFLLSRQIVE